MRPQGVKVSPVIRRETAVLAAISALFLVSTAAFSYGSYIATPHGDRAAWPANYLMSIASGLFTGLIAYLAVSIVHERSVRRSTEEASRQARVRELAALIRSDTGDARRSLAVLRELGAVDDGSLAGLSFVGASLREADFDNADLRTCDFSGCDLQGASFVGAVVDRAWFVRANLRGAILEFASMDGARFDGCEM